MNGRVKDSDKNRWCIKQYGQLHKRLRALLGHEVFLIVATLEEGMFRGVIREIGIDYLVLDTQINDDENPSAALADFWIKLNTIVCLCHPHDCTACSVNTADMLTKCSIESCGVHTHSK
jgi:hypothetical protein